MNKVVTRSFIRISQDDFTHLRWFIPYAEPTPQQHFIFEERQDCMLSKEDGKFYRTSHNS